MKKLILIALINFGLVLVSVTLVFSQNSDLNNNAEVRLQQIETKRASESANTTTQGNKAKDQKTISFTEGSVIAASGTTLTVSSENGTRIVYTSDSTKFINFDSTGKKLIGFGDIKINDTIMIVGVSQISGNGSARLVIRDQNRITKTFSLFGKINNLMENTLILSHFTRADLPNHSLSLTNETIISSTKNKTLDRTSLVPGTAAIISGIVDEKGTFFSKAVFLPNPRAKTATPSAQ
mgnify:CR=1 FL=1